MTRKYPMNCTIKDCMPVIRLETKLAKIKADLESLVKSRSYGTTIPQMLLDKHFKGD